MYRDVADTYSSAVVLLLSEIMSEYIKEKRTSWNLQC